MPQEESGYTLCSSACFQATPARGGITSSSQFDVTCPPSKRHPKHCRPSSCLRYGSLMIGAPHRPPRAHVRLVACLRLMVGISRYRWLHLNRPQEIKGLPSLQILFVQCLHTKTGDQAIERGQRVKHPPRRGLNKKLDEDAIYTKRSRYELLQQGHLHSPLHE